MSLRRFLESLGPDQHAEVEQIGEIATTGISAISSARMPNHDSTSTIAPVAAE